MEQLELPYVVKLNIFQGPLDLLLELIKKNKMDIYDIPIAAVTDQYLEYLEIIQLTNMETVGDYLSLAAELGYIKSRMLLPDPVVDEDEDIDDPRAELVQRLIEYEKYRKIADELNEMDILGREVFAKGTDYKYEFGEPDVESEMLKTDLWSLIDAFREFCKRRQLDFTEDLSYEIESFSVKERIIQVLDMLREKKTILFMEIFTDQPRKIDIVVTFIALLEIIKDGLAGVSQRNSYENIEIIYIGEGSIE